MPRVTQKEVLADRQDVQQPPLFDDSALPVCLPVLESVRRQAYEHKGARLLEDDAKALRLVECLVSRWGVKKIARELMISPHTVRAARRELALQGKLAPYKQRVVEMMEDVIEAGLEKYRDAMESGHVTAAQIPVGLGIIFDKRQLANGEPTSIGQRQEATADDLNVEKLNEYFERLPVARTGVVDVASDSVSTGACLALAISSRANRRKNWLRFKSSDLARSSTFGSMSESIKTVTATMPDFPLLMYTEYYGIIFRQPKII